MIPATTDPCDTVISLIHFTPRRNVEAIGRRGILRKYCAGAPPAIWLVSREGMIAVLDHLCQYHHLSWHQFAAYRVLVDPTHLRGTANPNRYRYVADVPPSDCMLLPTFDRLATAAAAAEPELRLRR